MAHTRPGIAGEAATPIRPFTPSGRPRLHVRSAHVSPPSVDRKMPLPGPPLVKLQGCRIVSHVAA